MESRPEDILGVKPGKDYDRESYFSEIRNARDGIDLDPCMLHAHSGRDIHEAGLPPRPSLVFGFTSRNLLDWMMRNARLAHKSVKAAATYGYMGRGSSSGGINGVLKLGDSRGDLRFIHCLQHFGPSLELILHDYGFSSQLKIEPVKIVAHIPSGDRILGYMQRECEPSPHNLRAVFFTVCNYNS